MATPAERFNDSEQDTAPLAEVIPLSRMGTAPEASSPPQIEGISLPAGEIKQSAFFVIDGLTRTWLRNSVISKDMDPEEAVRVYKCWNPDPEFTVEQLFIQ